MTAHAFNPRIWKTEAGRPLWVQGLTGLYKVLGQATWWDPSTYKQTITPVQQKADIRYEGILRNIILVTL